MARTLCLVLAPDLAPLSGDIGGLGGKFGSSGISLAL